MARSTKQIQQELDNIKQTVTELAEELQTLYDRYIASLSESAQKQLILASYQLCTQIYPETFLAMSFSQRQDLQQALRQLSNEIQPLLSKKLTPEDFNKEQVDLNLIAEMLRKLPLERSPQNAEEPNKLDRLENTEEGLTADEEEENELTAMTIEEVEEEDISADTIVEDVEEFNLDKLKNLAEGELEVSSIAEIDLSNPRHLILWHRQTESRIRKTLDDTSRKANKYLQKFDIVPNRLPPKVIDVALQAGESSSGHGKLPKAPNILHLIIETEKKQKGQKKKNSTATPISLLRLRLAEIEFADPKLSSQRTEIRMLLKKVKQLKDLYQEKERDYSIAEADAAWRSSWYEG